MSVKSANSDHTSIFAQQYLNFAINLSILMA